MALLARALGTFLPMMAATAALVVVIGLFEPAPEETEEWLAGHPVSPTEPDLDSVPGTAPDEGELAPDFSLRTADGKETVTLSDFRGKRPVALIFGSYT